MPSRKLAVDADLTLSLGTRVIRVRGRGEGIDIDVPLSLWRHAPGRAFRRRHLPRLGSLLAIAGLTARVRVAGRSLVHVGAKPKATLLGRLLGLSPRLTPGPQTT